MREYAALAIVGMVLITPRTALASETPFVLGNQGGIVVPVTLNGQGPFRMLLDTGATHSAITEDVVEALGSQVVARTNVISPTGSALRPIASINALEIGPIRVDLILPSVAPRGSFDRKANIKGLIGQDVLAGLRYTLDFKRRVIEWHDRAPRKDGIEVTLSFEHGRFMASLPQESETLRLVPDSGAGALVLFQTPSRRKITTAETGETVELSTGTGARPVRVVRVRALWVGKRVMRNLQAVTIDDDDVHPAGGDGLLPLHIFERVTFDGPARLLILG
jgi:predicted aspartyl protease